MKRVVRLLFSNYCFTAGASGTIELHFVFAPIVQIVDCERKNRVD